MSSSQVSPSEALDLLHKLITESTKVQACILGDGFTSVVIGRLEVDPSGKIIVKDRDEPNSPFIVFDLSRAFSVRYGEARGDSVGAGVFRRDFTSAMAFQFKNGGTVTLFEFKD